MRFFSFWAAGVATLCLTAPATAQALKIEDIRVQLFYERSGTLSPDLTKQKDLSLHNTMLGEGAAKEPANSFLVAVVISGQPSSFDKSKVDVTVINTKTRKKIAGMTFGNLLFDDQGKIVKPLMVDNQVCVPVRITAKSGASEKTAEIPFQCGE